MQCRLPCLPVEIRVSRLRLAIANRVRGRISVRAEERALTMIARFRELPRALYYVSEGLRGLEGSGPYELLAIDEGSEVTRSRGLPKDDLLAVAAKLYGNFPEATVAMGQTLSGHAYAGIQCACETEHRMRCPHHCHHSRSRPLMLIVSHLNGTPPDVETIADARERVVEAIHDDLASERGHSDSSENTHLAHSRHSHEEREREYRRWLNS